MDGERKRVHSRDGKGKKASADPGKIQEYDFFVTQDAIENQQASEVNRPKRTKKGRGRSKRTTFFILD